MEPRLDACKRVPGALPAMRGLEDSKDARACRGDRAAAAHNDRLARDGVFHGS